MTTLHSVTTQPACIWLWPRSLIHCSPLITTSVHGAFTKQSLRSVGIPAAVLSTLSRLASGEPLPAKWTIHGRHTWSGGTIYGNTICRRWSGRGTNCGVTDPYMSRKRATTEQVRFGSVSTPVVLCELYI